MSTTLLNPSGVRSPRRFTVPQVVLIDWTVCRFKYGLPILPGEGTPLTSVHNFKEVRCGSMPLLGIPMRHKLFDVIRSEVDRETYFIVRHRGYKVLAPILVGEDHRLELLLHPRFTTFNEATLLGYVDPRFDRFVTIRWFEAPTDLRMREFDRQVEAMGRVVLTN